MQQQPQRADVFTGVATIGAVLAGFVEALLTNDVPKDWRSVAWIVILIALALQLLIASRLYRDWFLNVLYVLLGLPIGIAINLMAAALPSTIKQVWTLAIIGAVLFLMLAGAAIGHIVPSVSRLRGSVWGLLARLLPVFLGIAAGTIASIQLIDFVNYVGGPAVSEPQVQVSTAEVALSVVVIPLCVIPLVGSIFASWMSGRVGSGVGAGVIAATLAYLLAGVYFQITAGVSALLWIGVVLLGLIPWIVGVPIGLIGGYLGASIRRIGAPSAIT